MLSANYAVTTISRITKLQQCSTLVTLTFNFNTNKLKWESVFAIGNPNKDFGVYKGWYASR